MTRIERLQTLSSLHCCVCDHHLSVQELEEFYTVADESMHGAVYCNGCLEDHALICRECSTRYTADGVCGECAAKEYGLVG